MDMIEDIETEDLNEIVRLIKAQYGYDFGGYSEASLKRRFAKFANHARVSVYDLKYNITNDKTFFFWLLESLTVNVTEMFRDPSFYKAMKAKVLPVLSTYPVIKIWHAGCSTGEEAFSMAILLKEAGLLDRSKIYATDINMANIEKAASGILPLTQMKEYTTNYQRAGGEVSFSEYYTALYDHAIISSDIRKHILFSQHNLVTDYVFNEFQLICCRNVLIYFNRELQNHVLDLFRNSLAPLGYLALGLKESMIFSGCRSKFEDADGQHKIYRLRA
jgi:chemotaxis protein methyltransferase CheR